MKHTGISLSNHDELSFLGFADGLSGSGLSAWSIWHFVVVSGVSGREALLVAAALELGVAAAVPLAVLFPAAVAVPLRCVVSAGVSVPVALAEALNAADDGALVAEEDTEFEAVWRIAVSGGTNRTVVRCCKMAHFQLDSRKDLRRRRSPGLKCRGRVYVLHPAC